MAANTDVTVLIKLKDEISKGLNDIGNKTDAVGKKMGVLGKVIGTAFKAAAIGAGIAVTALGTALISSIKAAAEAEAEQVKLNSILKQSKGNFEDLKKIADDVGRSYLKLGFDDEQTSLTFAKFNQILGDTAKAQEWLAATADYARFKNIDLETATNNMILSLENGGRVARQLGIDVKESATSTEILIAVQEKLKGQAEAYATTFSGRMAAFNEQFANLKEAIGAPFLGLLTNLFGLLNEKMLQINMDEVSKRITQGFADIANAVEVVRLKFVEFWELISPYIIPIINLTAENIKKLTEEFNFSSEQLIILKDILKGVGAALMTALVIGVNLAIGAINLLILIVRGAISIIKFLTNHIIELNKKFWDTVNAIKAVVDWMKKIPSKITTTIEQITKKVSGKQIGGLVTPNESYVVGERGMEMFKPATTGRIIPTEQLTQSSSGGVVLNVNVGLYAGTETEKRNIAESLYKGLVQLAGMQNKTVAELLGA